MNARLILVVLVGVVALAVPRSANGQFGPNGCPYVPYCWGYGYGSVSANDVPYFSLYPPVYYSYRVARTYGYSPFAYPPGVMTPGSEPPREVVVRGAYPAGEAAETSEEQQGGPKPLRIDNPFVEQRNRTGVTKNHGMDGHRPQVVFPAAMAQRQVKAAGF
jgi:hypothetical protein